MSGILHLFLFLAVYSLAVSAAELIFVELHRRGRRWPFLKKLVGQPAVRRSRPWRPRRCGRGDTCANTRWSQAS